MYCSLQFKKMIIASSCSQLLANIIRLEPIRELRVRAPPIPPGTPGTAPPQGIKSLQGPLTVMAGVVQVCYLCVSMCFYGRYGATKEAGLRQNKNMETDLQLSFAFCYPHLKYCLYREFSRFVGTYPEQIEGCRVETYKV